MLPCTYKEQLPGGGNPPVDFNWWRLSARSFDCQFKPRGQAKASDLNTFSYFYGATYSPIDPVVLLSSFLRHTFLFRFLVFLINFCSSRLFHKGSPNGRLALCEMARPISCGMWESVCCFFIVFFVCFVAQQGLGGSPEPVGFSGAGRI